MPRNGGPVSTAGPDSKVGLALAGGGPEGAIYEIGVLRALDEALEGVDFTNLHVYVGVSAGAFINANLANNINTAQMCRAIVSQEPCEHPFVPETFFSPAVGELWKRDRKSTRLNSSHSQISYAVFCLKKKKRS